MSDSPHPDPSSHPLVVLLVQAIGMCPKEKLFKGYVQLERDLGEIDRCRKVYRCALPSFRTPSMCVLSEYVDIIVDGLASISERPP